MLVLRFLLSSVFLVMMLTLDSGTARAPTDGLVNVFLVYVGQASGHVEVGIHDLGGNVSVWG